VNNERDESAGTRRTGLALLAIDSPATTKRQVRFESCCERGYLIRSGAGRSRCVADLAEVPDAGVQAGLDIG
jgi:hypothetical protein